MSESLKIGDLVQVINHPCKCSPDPHVGWIEKINHTRSGWHCPPCGRINPAEMSYFLRINETSGFCRPAWCLRKIPPLAELDGKTTQEKLVNPFKADAKRRHAEQDKVEVLR